MQIKTTIIYHLTLVRIDIKKRRNSKWCSGCGEKATCVPTGEDVSLCKTIEKSIDIPQKFKNRTDIWSNNFMSVYLSERNNMTILKRYLYPMFIAAWFTIVNK